MKKAISRRTVLNVAAIAGSIIPFLAVAMKVAGATGLAPLDSNDSTAKALGFVGDANIAVAGAIRRTSQLKNAETAPNSRAAHRMRALVAISLPDTRSPGRMVRGVVSEIVGGDVLAVPHCRFEFPSRTYYRSGDPLVQH